MEPSNKSIQRRLRQLLSLHPNRLARPADLGRWATRNKRLMQKYHLWSGRGLKYDTIIDSCVFLDAFQDDSKHKDDARAFLEIVIARQMGFIMPAHGWFEILCGIRKFRRKGSYVEHLENGLNNVKIQLVHIDDAFIDKYSEVEIPELGNNHNIRTHDYMFVVMAIKNRKILVTHDTGILRPLQMHSISIMSCSEWLVKYK